MKIRIPSLPIFSLAAAALLAIPSAICAPIAGSSFFQSVSFDSGSSASLTSNATSATLSSNTANLASQSGIYANFSTISLANVGDVITLTFNLTLNNVGGQFNGFRVSLSDNNSATQQTGTIAAAGFPSDYSSIVAAIGTDGGTSGTNTGNSSHAFLTDYAGGADADTLLDRSSGTDRGENISVTGGGLLNNGTSYAISLQLTRVIDGPDSDAFGEVQAILSLDGTPIQNNTLLSGGSATNFDGFNTLKFGLHSSATATGAAFTVSNIDIAAVPEPSTTALLIGAGLTGLILARRRRATRA